MESDTTTKPTYRKITYIPISFERLKLSFKKYDIQLIAPASPNFVELISKKLDPKPPVYDAGVYEIPFHLNNNDLVYYIGMTEWKFCNWFKEHKEDIKFGKLNTALSRLCPSGEMKSIDFVKIWESLDNIQEITKSVTMESLIIYRTYGQNSTRLWLPSIKALKLWLEYDAIDGSTTTLHTGFWETPPYDNDIVCFESENVRIVYIRPC